MNIVEKREVSLPYSINNIPSILHYVFFIFMSYKNYKEEIYFINTIMLK